MKLKPLALLLTFPCLANAAEVTLMDEIRVTAPAGQLPLTAAPVSNAVLNMMRSATSDSASLLRDIPGVSLAGAGGVSSLPSIHGLADDRLRIKVDGMDFIAACPNHMNSPLSYIDPTNIASAKVYAGVSPVSVGGDSLGGSIVVESTPPVFARPGEGMLFAGEAGAFYRSNGDAKGANLAASVASEQASLSYTGAFAKAEDYKSGRDFKNYTFTGRAGHTLGLDEVGSTAYETFNQALKLALKRDNHLVEFKYGRQHIPDENFPNQRMDMTDNVSDQFNLAYTGKLGFGKLKARAYYEHTQHEMDFGQDKRFWYGALSGGNNPPGGQAVPCSPLSGFGDPGFPATACAAGMPMYTDGKNTGLSVSADVFQASGDTMRVGGEYQAYQMNDWWTPSGAMMWPGIFQNINDGQRDRYAVFGELEMQRNNWTHILGLRHETVKMNAGNVAGYAATNAGGSNQLRDSTNFNALSRAKTDHNLDISWLASFVKDATQTYEVGLSQKTRSPNLYERYTWSTWQMAAFMNNFVGDGNGYFGDVNLKPEVARKLSLTADLHDAGKEKWGFKASPYYTLVSDYIDAVQWNGATNLPAAPLAANNFTVLRYANQSARLYGIDISGHGQVANGTGYGDFALKGGINYTRGKNRDTGNNLYNIMPLNARLALTQKLGAWRNSLEGEFVTRKNDVNRMRNELETPGYGLLHLRARYEQKRYSVDFGIENLFDRHYALPIGGAYVGQGTTMAIPPLPNQPQWGTPVPGPGRSLYAGLNVKF